MLIKLLVVIVFTLCSAQLAVSQANWDGRLDDRGCPQVVLGGDESDYLAKLPGAISTESIKLAAWDADILGQRHYDLLANDDNSTGLRFGLSFGTPDLKARRNFKATSVGTSYSHDWKFGKFTLPEPQRERLLSAAKFTAAYFSGLPESTFEAEIEKMLQKVEAVNMKEADMARAAAGKSNNAYPEFSLRRGDFTVTVSRSSTDVGVHVFRHACKKKIIDRKK